MKRIIMKLKVLWKHFIKIIFKSKTPPKPKSALDNIKEKFKWTVVNRPKHFDFFCPICGEPIFLSNIQAKHFSDNLLTLIYDCDKCHFSVQTRYNSDMEEIKKM